MPPPLAETLAALARAHRARLGRLLATHGLHAGQDGLLIELWRTPGQRPAELARHLDVEPPTITRMVARLERSGLVERRPDPNDARAVRLYPTPRSRLLEASVRRARAELDDQILSALGATDGERLQRLAVAALAALTSLEPRPD